MAMDYYEILGVEPDANAEAIKRRYRALVREHHPDIASDKDGAHSRMQIILEAWTVLSNPEQRARYDRKRPPVAPAPAQPDITPPSSTVAPHRRTVVGAVPRAEPAQPSSSKAPSSSPPPRPPRVGARPGMPANVSPYGQRRYGPPQNQHPRTRLLTMVFEAAQLYHQEGHMPHAIEICNHVLKVDPGNAEASALLGDIYAEQGRKDVALLMFERAMRAQPNNLLYRQKMEAVRKGNPNGSAKPSAAQATAQATAEFSSRFDAAASPPATAKTAATPKAAGCGAATLLLACALLLPPLGWLLHRLV